MSVGLTKTQKVAVSRVYISNGGARATLSSLQSRLWLPSSCRMVACLSSKVAWLPALARKVSCRCLNTRSSFAFELTTGAGINWMYEFISMLFTRRSSMRSQVLVNFNARKQTLNIPVGYYQIEMFQFYAGDTPQCRYLWAWKYCEGWLVIFTFYPVDIMCFRCHARFLTNRGEGESSPIDVKTSGSARPESWWKFELCADFYLTLWRPYFSIWGYNYCTGKSWYQQKIWMNETFRFLLVAILLAEMFNYFILVLISTTKILCCICCIFGPLHNVLSLRISTQEICSAIALFAKQPFSQHKEATGNRCRPICKMYGTSISVDPIGCY